MTTVREALHRDQVERGYRGPPNPRGWYRDPWFRVPIAGRQVPVWPVVGFRSGLIAHDLHHLLTGYEMTIRGELQLAGWELGSGGCGRRLYFWCDRLIAAAIGLVCAPSAVVRAFRRGLSMRNLNRVPTPDLLEMDVEEARRRIES